MTQEFLDNNKNYFIAKKALDDLLDAQQKRLDAERIAAEQEAARERAEQIERDKLAIVIYKIGLQQTIEDPNAPAEIKEKASIELNDRLQ